jgi:hypothetical protein
MNKMYFIGVQDIFCEIGNYLFEMVNRVQEKRYKNAKLQCNKSIFTLGHV